MFYRWRVNGAACLLIFASVFSVASEKLPAIDSSPASWKTFFKQSWELYREKKWTPGLSAVRDAQALFDQQRERPQSDLAELLNLESLILRSMGNFQEAAQVCERLTKIDQKRFKEPNSMLAADYECLGETYEKTDRREMAYKAYKKALSIREGLIQTDAVVLRRLKRIIARVAPADANEDVKETVSPQDFTEPQKSLTLDEGLVKKIKQLCLSLDQGSISLKLHLASKEIGAYALKGEVGQFFPDSLVTAAQEGNLFSDRPFVELVCHGESKSICPQFRDELEERVRKIILLRAIFGGEKWQKERIYDLEFLTVTDFGNLVYPQARDHCVLGAASK